MKGFAPLLSAVLGKAFGDPGAAPVPRPPRAAIPMLSHWLPYRSYDPTRGLYYNSASRGFVVELAPLLGADERTGEIFSQFLSEGIPPGASIQITQWMSPRVAGHLRQWFLPRYGAGGVYERLAQHRTDHLANGVWTSLSADAPFHLRLHRVFLSLALPDGARTSDDELAASRDSMISMMRAIDVSARKVEPAGLLSLIDDMTSPTTASGEEPAEYNPFDSIADQAVRRDLEVAVEPDRLLLRTERFRATGLVADGTPEIGEIHPDRFEVRSYGVRNLPREWAPWDTVKLIGDPFLDKLRMPCPVATTLCLHYPDEQSAVTRANLKSMRLKSLAESQSAKWMPQLRDQSRDWEHVQARLREGQKIVRACYTVTAFSPAGKGDEHERNLKAVYKASGWDLQGERRLQMFALLAAMPMALGNGLVRDLERMKRMRTLMTTTAASIAPVQGEYLGGPLPHLLLVGRRGQPFFWSPFENAAGNHNVAVFGKSGSGKSVALQEIAAALAGAGAKVIVIDDGRSFEHSCKLQGGAFVEFTFASGFCLNPFSMIDAAQAQADGDYKLDCMAMLKAIIGQMGRHVDTLTDTERGLIDQAVNAEWERHASDGSVDGVITALRGLGHPQADALAIAMAPFAAGGTYGKFFVGRSSIEINAAFTVFELSDLSGREELRSVVLTAIMFLSSQAMRADRSSRKALLLDEAWQLLQGGSMAEFVETYARTCRKYGSALITATQSLHDYYKSEGSLAALENSDWFVVLAQKPETIGGFADLKRFDMTPRTEQEMRSIKRNGAEYSEMIIKGPDTYALGRLVLDPFSATLYSSSPQTYAAIQELVTGGMGIEAAIEEVAARTAPGWRARTLPQSGPAGAAQ